MDLKQEVGDDSNIMEEIVNDIKTMNDNDQVEDDEDTADDVTEESLNDIVKSEFDEGISFNNTVTTYSFEMSGVSDSLESEAEDEPMNSELNKQTERNVMKDEDFVTDTCVKLESDMYQHTDESLDIVGDEENGFNLECLDDVKNDIVNSGRRANAFKDGDHEVSDSGKEDDTVTLFREVTDSEMGYDHDTDSYNEEVYSDKTGLAIKKEKADDIEQETNQKSQERNDQNKNCGRKTKKAKSHLCDLCNKAFTSDNRLKRHKNQIHPGGGKEEKMEKQGKYVCEVCNKRFVSQSRLRLHTVTHTGEKPFTCDFCGQKFSHPTNKRRHMRTHTGDKPFVCLFCGKSFPVKHYLKDHMVKHTGEKPHECKLCFMTFAHRFSLKQHELLKHPGGEVNFKDTYDDRPFSCEICGRRFTQQSSLKIHVRLHTGARPYKCTECEASFIRSDTLLRHKLEHSGQRPFSCDMCEKTFTSAYILKQHRNVHTGDRRQQCEHCGIELANKESLARHVMRHTGESLLECKTCHKKFISEQSLKRHHKYPCEEKIYECKECDYRNISESKLKRHMLKHNAQKLLECKVCKNKFTYPSNLKRHMKVHEKDHEKKARKKETIISNDDVGKFIAESTKDIDADKTEETKPLRGKKTGKKPQESLTKSSTLDSSRETYNQDSATEVKNECFSFMARNENVNVFQANESKFCANSGLATEILNTEQENCGVVDEIKQRMNKDVKMKAFFTLQYYDYIARRKEHEDMPEGTVGLSQKIDNDIPEGDGEDKNLHDYDLKLNNGVSKTSNGSYFDENRRLLSGSQSEMRLNSVEDMDKCQSSFGFECSQNRSLAANLSDKNSGSVDLNYQIGAENEFRKGIGNFDEKMTAADSASDWRSFDVNSVGKIQREQDVVKTYTLKLPSVSLSRNSHSDTKMLPSEDECSSVSPSKYSAVMYNPTMYTSRLPTFAGSFFSHHNESSSKSVTPDGDHSENPTSTYCTRNQTHVHDVLKKLYNHQKLEDESDSSHE